MRPINFPTADTKHIGGPGVDDLYTESVLELNPDSGALVKASRSRWRPDDTERMAIALGGDVVLDVFGSPLPPVRVLATALPIETPEKVYATFDRILAQGIAWSLSANLAELGFDVSVDTALGWSDEQRKELAEWMSGWSAIGDNESGLADWIATAPAFVR